MSDDSALVARLRGLVAAAEDFGPLRGSKYKPFRPQVLLDAADAIERLMLKATEERDIG